MGAVCRLLSCSQRDRVPLAGNPAIGTGCPFLCCSWGLLLMCVLTGQGRLQLSLQPGVVAVLEWRQNLIGPCPSWVQKALPKAQHLLQGCPAQLALLTPPENVGTAAASSSAHLFLFPTLVGAQRQPCRGGGLSLRDETL